MFSGNFSWNIPKKVVCFCEIIRPDIRKIPKKVVFYAVVSEKSQKRGALFFLSWPSIIHLLPFFLFVVIVTLAHNVHAEGKEGSACFLLPAKQRGI